MRRASSSVCRDSARAAGLPHEPLILKALEGASKGADSARIVTAVRALGGRLQEAARALGPAAALTGPAARGDWATVRRHLEALPGHGFGVQLDTGAGLRQRAAEALAQQPGAARHHCRLPAEFELIKNMSHDCIPHIQS